MQANATSGIGIDQRQIKCTVYDCLIDGRSPGKLFRPQALKSLSVMPSNIDLVGAEIEMLGRKGKDTERDNREGG